MRMPKTRNKVDRSALFGETHDGWSLQRYLIYAIEHEGYETVCNHGRQGSGKSNFMLQQGYWILQDWDEVLKALVFTPTDFVQKLKDLGKGRRVPWIGFDDVGVSYPASTFRTDVKLYQDIDSVWAAIRTKCNVISLTIPLIDRLSKNIRDNVSIEIYLGRNRHFMVERIVRTLNFYKMLTDLDKILIEEGKLDIFKVPKGVFAEYWDMRLNLTELALNKLEQSSEMRDPTGYMPVRDAALKAGISATTLQQAISRGVYEGRKIGGLLHILEEDFENYILNSRKARA